MNHSNVVPDMMVFAKGVGSGMPISGVVARSDLTANQVGTEVKRPSSFPLRCDEGLNVSGHCVRR